MTLAEAIKQSKPFQTWVFKNGRFFAKMEIFSYGEFIVLVGQAKA